MTYKVCYMEMYYSGDWSVCLKRNWKCTFICIWKMSSIYSNFLTHFLSRHFFLTHFLTRQCLSPESEKVVSYIGINGVFLLTFMIVLLKILLLWNKTDNSLSSKKLKKEKNVCHLLKLALTKMICWLKKRESWRCVKKL